MSLAKDNIWKLLAPLVVMGVMFLIPVPNGMPPQAWHYFAVFVAMIVGMILEPIPATAISFIAVTICVIGSNYLLFDAKELADPAFNAQKQALKWGLAGFSSTTVWLVFGAFIFALGYEVSGLGRRIALFLVKFMGKRTLTLGYAIVIIDILLAPFTPSNTARTGGTVFPVIKNLPPLFKSFPNDPSARRIGGYLMWMMVIRGARFLDTCRGEVFCFCNKSGGWFVNYGINRNNSPYEKNNPHTDCYTYLFWCRLYCFLFSVGVHTQLVSCIGKTFLYTP